MTVGWVWGGGWKAGLGIVLGRDFRPLAALGVTGGWE